MEVGLLVPCACRSIGHMRLAPACAATARAPQRRARKKKARGDADAAVDGVKLVAPFSGDGRMPAAPAAARSSRARWQMQGYSSTEQVLASWVTVPEEGAGVPGCSFFGALHDVASKVDMAMAMTRCICGNRCSVAHAAPQAPAMDAQSTGNEH